MSFPNRVIFQQNQSQAQRPPVNDDYISGLQLYFNSNHSWQTYPTAITGHPQFSNTTNTIAFLSLQQAVNSGINNNHVNESAAVAKLVVTAASAVAGTTVQIYVQEPFTNVLVAQYTCTGNDTATAIGAGLVTSMGALATGYSMTNTSGTLALTARPGLGAWLNTTTGSIWAPVSVVINPGSGSGVTVAVTQATGATGSGTSLGVASQIDVWYYHISEYFRLMPNGKLYVTITDNQGTFDTTFADIKSAQSVAQGQIRQFGCYTEQLYNTEYITGAKSMKTYLGTLNQPAEIYLAMDAVGTGATWGITGAGSESPTLTGANTWTGSDTEGTNFFDTVADLPDMSGLDCAGIGVVAGQDGIAQGAFLFNVYQHSITTLGATLGATSNAPVNVDIGWVQQYNIANGIELNVPAFFTGESYSSVFSSENNALTQVDNYRYNFIMNYPGQVGTYFNDDKTATSSTDSFANINDNRVIDKVQRVVYTNLLPLVNGPIELNADGTIPPLTLAMLDSLARNPMEQMARNGEIAGDANGNLAASAVQIDPNQNVVANNGITIAVQPTENGTARQILVPIGFAN